MELSKQRIYAAIALLAVILVGGAVWYWQTRVNYLISGVPYHGIYDGFMDYQNNAVTNAMMVLEYYGDDRFPHMDLMGRFEEDSEGDREIKQLESFFKEAGYETSVKSDVPGWRVLWEIKKFVNPKKNIPVIVYQKRSPDPIYQANVYSLAIGVSDRNKKITAHDYSFGNNYERSYADFKKLFSQGARKEILAVWPSAALAQNLKGIDASRPYPPRLEVMDEGGPLFAGPHAEIRAVLVEAQKSTEVGDYDKAFKLYEEVETRMKEILADPRFETSHHPIVKVSFLANLARSLISLETIRSAADEEYRRDSAKINEAIALLRDKALPLNKDLDKPYRGWELSSHMVIGGKMAHPWVWLGRAYSLRRNFGAAFESLEKAWKIDSTDFQLTMAPRFDGKEAASVYDIYRGAAERTLRFGSSSNEEKQLASKWLIRVK